MPKQADSKITLRIHFEEESEIRRGIDGEGKYIEVDVNFEL